MAACIILTMYSAVAPRWYRMYEKLYMGVKASMFMNGRGLTNNSSVDFTDFRCCDVIHFRLHRLAVIDFTIDSGVSLPISSTVWPPHMR